MSIGLGAEGDSWPCHVSHEAPTGSAQTTENSAKEEDKQVPESAALQHPKFKSTPGPQLPTRRRCLSESDELQDPQPVWDAEPQFCQGFLIQGLWELFMDSRQKNQQEHGGEDSSQVRGNSQAQAFLSLFFPLSSPHLACCHGNREAAGIGEYP